MASRRVFISKGFAFVPQSDALAIVVSSVKYLGVNMMLVVMVTITISMCHQFRQRLSLSLQHAARNFVYLKADTRLGPLLKVWFLAEHYHYYHIHHVRRTHFPHVDRYHVHNHCVCHRYDHTLIMFITSFLLNCHHRRRH